MTATRAPEPGPEVDSRGGRVRGALDRLWPELDRVGSEPDPRFSFANERTFLAWARTSLALIAGGLAAAQVLRFGLDGDAHLVVAIPAIALGGLIGIGSYRTWRLKERAMRLGYPLGYTPLTRILAIGIACLALVSVILVVISALAR